MSIFYSRAGLLFYLLEFFLWGFFSIGTLLGADSRTFLGKLGFIIIPLYGLFILLSAVIHLLAVLRSWAGATKPLLIINIAGILGYILLSYLIWQFALYR